MLESVWERLRAFGCKQTEHILYWISIWCVLGVGLVYIAAFYIAACNRQRPVIAMPK